MSAPPTPDEIYDRARERYLHDAAFHAKVKLTATLVGVEPVYALAAAVHAAELAAELISLDQEVASGLGARVIDGKLDIFEMSLVAHHPGPGCVVLSKEMPVCPGCGVGKVEVVDG